MSFISINGTITPAEDARISPLDRGFLFADAIFETLVAVDGVILNLEAHLQRLFESAEKTKISIPQRPEELAFELGQLLTFVTAPKVSLRLIITRGEGLGLGLTPSLKPNRVMIASKAPQLPAELLSQGITLMLKQSPYTVREASAKVANYLPSILAIQQAQTSGFQEVLWTNSEGEITEAATANVFFVSREGTRVVVSTPSLWSGLLRGITRSQIIHLLSGTDLAVEEVVIFSEELARFDEAFLCSTVRGLVPISRIGDHVLQTCHRNSTFHKVIGVYEDWVSKVVMHHKAC